MLSPDATPVDVAAVDVAAVNVVTRATESCTAEEKQTYDELLLAREPLVSEFWKGKHKSECQRNWDLFYKRHKSKAYKDRHWLHNEFPLFADLLTRGEPFRMFEVGCGAGNTFIPLVEKHSQIYCCGVDLSKHAIDLCVERVGSDNKQVDVFVGDLAKQDCAKVIGINEPSFDVTTVLFVLSAVPPEMWKPFLDNVVSAMRPGSLLLFRDYARYDMAEFRFKASSKLDQHLFLRQDLTLSFFFSREQVIELMEASGLVVEEALYFKKAETNRKTMKTRYRIFVNATFRKP